MGFGVEPFMGRIHWNYSLLAALLERWDSSTSTFHLLIGEMTIMVEDIHHLYHLPIHGQWIQHTFNRDDALSAIAYLYGANRVDTIAS